MGTKGEALAGQFEVKIHEAVTTLRALSDADWAKVTEAEQWPVGVTAHHYASVLERISQLIAALASGQPPGRFSRVELDGMNAQHAQDHAACTKAETIALLEKGAASAVAVLRGLSDDQLARSGTVLQGEPPVTTEEFVARVLLNHADQHFGSIRKTVAR